MGQEKGTVSRPGFKHRALPTLANNRPHSSHNFSNLFKCGALCPTKMSWGEYWILLLYGWSNFVEWYKNPDISQMITYIYIYIFTIITINQAQI